ncbi:hypothetical protein C1H46_000043 [Malus baccata]|uniref:Uncharacterized protein n=1 Tax=Malus baccata TaxID=106549 RepID=A0A540NSW2_MALBA|nr:hypothetical protein C1H46_000043 [Malus baccata]
MSSSSSSLLSNPKYSMSQTVNITGIGLKEEQKEPAGTYEHNYVSSHMHIKPTHTSQPLDKEVVLRRIRQHKRVNRVRATLQALLSSTCICILSCWLPQRTDFPAAALPLFALVALPPGLTLHFLLKWALPNSRISCLDLLFLTKARIILLMLMMTILQEMLLLKATCHLQREWLSSSKPLSKSELFHRHLAEVPWIPATIEGLKNPEYLWFNLNQLYGTLPSAISNCSTP